MNKELNTNEKVIKIFVSCHKKFKLPKSKFLYPVQVGTYFNPEIEGFLHDNEGGEGKNISNKNKKYCELTAQYYAWKNEEADYYGFFHYRRYLSFLDTKSNIYEIVSNDFEGFEEKFGYDDKTIYNLITKYDIIVPKKQFTLNNHFQYRYPCTQDIKDLNFCTEYIIKHYPEMKKAVKKYLHSSHSYLCNLFIMKKEIFKNYSSWLFEILEAHEGFNSHDDSDVQTYRVSGYLGERLFGIYITYLNENKNLKIKELQRVMIKNPNFEKELSPSKTAKNIFFIPFDLHRLPLASSLVQSIIDTYKDDIEIILAHTNIPHEFIQKIKQQTKEKHTYIKDICLNKNIHTYEQLLLSLPKLLINYEYITVLKPNCIVKNAIKHSNNEYTLSSAIDIDNAIRAKKNKKFYNKIKKLNLDINDLISNDRLDINLKKFERNTNTLGENCTFIDILAKNKEEIEILPQTQLVKFNSLFIKSRELNAYAPHNLFEEYDLAQKNPAVISFGGHFPPYVYPLTNFCYDFYETARKTPFYEMLIYSLSKNKPTRKEKRFKRRREKIEKLLPQGTNRRLFFRTISKKFY